MWPMKMNRGERMMMVNIHDSSDSVRNHDIRTDTKNTSTERHQPRQYTGSDSVKNRNARAVTVCLGLMCVLLLTAGIVRCVYFTTETNKLITHNNNLTKETEQLLTKYNELLNQSRILTEERDHLRNMNEGPLQELEVFQRQDVTQSEEDNKLMKAMKQLHTWLTEQGQHTDKVKWFYYKFSFYYISSNMMGWSESREDCERKGAYLVIIKSQEEQVFLQNALPSMNIWIGLSKKKGVWKWVDGTTLRTGYWRDGFPKNTDEDCAIITSLGWMQSSCVYTWKKRWICKKSFESLNT